MTIHYRDCIRRTQEASRLAGERVLSQGEFFGSRRIATFIRGLNSGRDMVLLSCRSESWPYIASGLEIQGRLAIMGVPVASVVQRDTHGGDPEWSCVLMSRLGGLDVRSQWNNLTPDGAVSLAKRVAGIVRASAQALDEGGEKSSAGAGKHLLGEKPAYEGMAGYLLARLGNTARGPQRQSDSLTRTIEALTAHLKKPAVVDLINDAPRSVFVYGLLDRNFLIDEGSLSGVSDLGEVFTGDQALVPAFADVLLARAGFGQRSAYISTWEKTWDLQEEDHKRMNLYRAVMAVDRQAIAGSINGNGKIRASMPEDFLADCVEQALATAV